MKKLTKQITLGVDPYTGKRIRKRISANSKTALDQAIREAQREFDREGKKSDTTVKEYFEQWYDAYASRLAPNTQANYRSTLNLCKGIYDKKMRLVTRTDLQKIINDNWEHPDTCRRLGGKLQTIWDLAMADGIVNRNIAVRLSRPKVIHAERRPLTAEEKKALDKADFTPDERFLVDILYNFGLRPGEALALCKSDVNFRDNTITISKSLTHINSKPIIKSTKTTKNRTLPVPDFMMAKFRKVEGLYFFHTEDGSPLTKMAAYAMSRSILDKINLAMGGTKKLRVTDMTLYTFRHNKATALYYYSGNLSLKKKAEYMGHSEEMFIRTYSHLVEDREETELLRQAIV